ncbi:aminotransferase class I/II-fold pyridoxal phosphate-dependent enzyme [Mucilaginibacter sp. PAMB04274]|uniref:aminotransferase class I/II-fold pyridoxal phosphate-dependent enzyme n=1 Tax=Mucilaginibacter sp. PAMB04274 TaxID=3138568 RepID=UPI0031F629E8
MEGIEANLYLDGKPGRTAVVNGKEYLFFTGYHYLGINSDPEFMNLVAEGMDKYGWLYPSSRISNTRLDLYEACEALLAKLTGTEDTVLFSSGFAAGRVAIAGHQTVYNSPNSHPAILQQKAIIQDMEEWQQWVLREGRRQASVGIPMVLASDSVNPLTSTVINFSFLAHLSQPALAIVDDSHGIGLLGENGFGTSATLPRHNQLNYILTYSLSKALGIGGGAISCTKEQAAALRNLPEYTGATPISPAQVYAFLKGQHIYTRQHEKLKANIAYFEMLVQDLPGIQHHPDLPVFILPSAINEDVFYNSGILISSFPYPNPAGVRLKRIVLNALHTFNDLDVLARVLRKAYQQQPIN